jgi:predicted Zn-dependent protease
MRIISKVFDFSSKNKKKSCFLLGAALALLVSCTAQTTAPGAVGVERKQFVMVSAAEVEKGSEKAYLDVMNKAKSEGKLNADAKDVGRVRSIAKNMIPQTAVFRKDAPNWKWEVNVIESDQLNAWCMAGGKIAFYSGLIDKLSLTDDEIAAVMGHEIAHALREHARERMSQQMATSLGVNLIAAGFGLGNLGANMTSLAAKVTFSLPYAREHETEADRMGVELAARAGYNPRAAVALWQKMAQQNKGGTPQLLSTHPAPENRMRDLEDYSERVQSLYVAAKQNK